MSKEQNNFSGGELLSQIRSRHQFVFAELVNRHTERYYRVAYRTFLKLWRQPESWLPKKKVKFTTWFYKVVMNLCIDWKKNHLNS